MRGLILTGLILALAGCATSKPTVDKEAVDDFIAVRGLESVDSIRTDSSDSWNDINLQNLIYDGRRDSYLIVFSRPCYELRDTRITPDRRYESNVIRARFDTIRGCRIDSIYALSEADEVELRQLGEAPGSRN